MTDLEIRLTYDLRKLLTVADIIDSKLVDEGKGYCNQQGTWHDAQYCALCAARGSIALVDGLIEKGK